eukprot:CAMPEP_0194211860 /NCGR_PEP_ID=MMETSP0156-20130528/11274_1 /TAXON_ID=33649 /ORGANISM="Thalassionema nitzschioides, Strain L26-B" /LENGTH=672 /DNA_ID=CAMNT_0038939543 /DNA_START=20 /DNA_END=2038 /DNA_ORIENTATION=+
MEKDISKQVAGVTEKRLIPVEGPEKEDGDTEYKRQVHHASVNRLRSLATQMSYRLDQGNGRCTYQLGVEDDGCHSLLDYDCITESARVLEAIARSLNAIVVERMMIQGEVTQGEDGNPILIPNAKPAHIHEPPFFSNNEKQYGKERLKDNETEEKKEPDEFRIKATPGMFTRCKLTIQKVETHLLDSSPFSLSDMSKSMKQILENSYEKSTPGVNEHDTKDSVTETLASRNIRIAVVGNVDAGKSSLIGTLTTSCLDDGRGKSRTSIMKHRHEIESGRTSTATTHLMGFRSTGEPVAARDKLRAKRKTEDEVARESHRIITLMDLAGHEKYLKTTVHGVSSGMADYALILVNSRHPPTHMTQHHLNLCCSFGIPVLVVFTKIDGCPPDAYKNCKKEVVKLLRAPDVGKKPYAVRNEKDIETCMGNLHALAPVIETSCVTGQGIDILQKMLFALPKRRRHEKKVDRPFEFLVEDTFNVPGVGGVVSGFVNAGELTVGATSHVFVGPTDDGTFMKTVAKSAHIARINTSHVTSGQSACLAFSLNKEMRKKLRRGMVVLKESPTSTKEFDAEICVLKGEGTTIRKSYQAYVHILNVRQSAYARKIELVNKTSSIDMPTTKGEKEDGVVLRPGSRAKVRFEFATRPEYIRPGMRMLFRDGRVRGIGVITGIPNMGQ